MSTQPVREHEVLLDANGNPLETWGGKFERKFKENPFVPILAGLTTVSLIVAGTKLRKRDSVGLNHWFRVRVVMQGFTIAAVVAGSWWYGQMKHQKDSAAVEQDRLIERAGFQARLRAAEEADRLERMQAEVQARQAAAQASSSNGGRWSEGWWGKGNSNK